MRELARARELITADKPESQEICFVPTGDYRNLLRSRLPPTHPAFLPGPIVTTDGETVGEHKGYAGFTVGQRKGLPGGFPEAMFVVEIRPPSKEVVIGPRELMWAREVEMDHLNWLGEPPVPGQDVQVQLRHRAKPVRAHIGASGDERLTLRLSEPQFAVTPRAIGCPLSRRPASRRGKDLPGRKPRDQYLSSASVAKASIKRWASGVSFSGTSSLTST